MTYRTSNVARLAGAVALLAVLPAWGVLHRLVAGETTVTTWALGLAVMFPASALLLGVAADRSPPRAGTEYATGLLVGVVTLSLAYLGLVAVDHGTVRAAAGVDAPALVAAAVGFALLGGVLALVDVLYVERPVTAASLEARYLDEPVRSD